MRGLGVLDAVVAESDCRISTNIDSVVTVGVLDAVLAEYAVLAESD